MIKVGITGGIGSGKSTISRILEWMGYPIYYADIRGKWLMHNHTQVMSSIKKLFGNNIYLAGGLLDRPKVASIVFNNTNMLAKLNNIVHPAVAQDFADWCSKMQAPILFKEAAIMFESGANKELHKVICISAPETMRIKRVINRDQTSERIIKERMQHQMAEQERINLSDFVIYNDGKQFVTPQLISIIKQLKQA